MISKEEIIICNACSEVINKTQEFVPRPMGATIDIKFVRKPVAWVQLDVGEHYHLNCFDSEEHLKER